MLLRIITGITLSTFQSLKDFQASDNDRIAQYVYVGILALPWFFRLPLVLYLHGINWLALVVRRRLFVHLSPERQARFVEGVITRLPFSGSLMKLVRTLGFIVLYDISR